MYKQGTLIVVAGPTAVGKSALALRLAHLLSVPIVSADSRQIYREMQIGTAAPSKQQQEGVKHYMLGIASVQQSYSAAQYEDSVMELLQLLFRTHKYVILVGGSMLYVDAILKGIDVMPSVDQEVRTQLAERYACEGLQPLLDELKLCDKSYYDYVDKRNYKRVIHGLEVFYSTGKPFSSFRTGRIKERPFHIVQLLVELPREELFQRINSRTILMMQEGWLQEAQALYPLKHLNALNTIGYKELFAYFEEAHNFNRLTPMQQMDVQLTYRPDDEQLQQAILKIQSNTRDYARKQMRWFKKDAQYRHLSPFISDEELLQMIA